MNLYTAATLAAGQLFPSSEDIPFDDKGYTTVAPILPPWKELIPASLASIIVFTLLYKYAGPIIKKSFRDRTAGIQTQLDESAAASMSASARDSSSAISTSSRARPSTTIASAWASASA